MNAKQIAQAVLEYTLVMCSNTLTDLLANYAHYLGDAVQEPLRQSVKELNVAIDLVRKAR